MIRPMASNVSALSGIAANGHQAITVGIWFPGGLSVMGLATNRHPELPTRTASPVALGSPTGCIVRPARRLLWPHLRLCLPPDGLWIIPPSCGTSPPAAEGPQFTLPVL